MAEIDHWWTAPALRGELDAILGLLNAGRASAKLDEERAARKYCDALNRAWNARARLESDDAPDSDWPRLKALVGGLSRDDALVLLRSAPLAGLVEIDPPILNHRKLLERGLLGSVGEIPEHVRREAGEAHVKLRRRIEAMSAIPADEELRLALVRLADLVYVIRSNLQHGEKFASTDPARVARDRVIAAKAVDMLELFFDLMLGKPSICLAAYGALAPGGALHSELAGAGGHWVPGVVTGQLRDGPFPMLVQIPAGAAVPLQLLRAAEGLPGLWSRLDEVEGSSYSRVLVPVETERGEVLVATLYAAASR